VTLQDLQEEAQTFLDYYVLGSTSDRALVAFPGSSFPGIKFRAPAVLGIRPEYTPIPDANDGTFIQAGVVGPEGTGPYLFLDRCPLRATNVTLVGGIVNVDFICVVKYPPGRFPDSSIDQTVEVRLPSNSSFNAVAIECLSQFEDAIAFDPDVGFPVGYSITVLDLRTFDSSTNG
jgi:hypothetical protein